MKKDNEMYKKITKMILSNEIISLNEVRMLLGLLLNELDGVKNTIGSISSTANITANEVSSSIRSLSGTGLIKAIKADNNIILNIAGIKYQVLLSNDNSFIPIKSVANDDVMARLMSAIDSKNIIDIIDIIAGNSVNWDYKDMTGAGVISKSCSVNNIDILTALLDSGMSSHGGLMWACQNGNKYRKLIPFFVKNGADVNTGDTLMPLQWAVFTGSVGIASELIAEGADVDIISDSGEPLLKMAITSGNKQIIELLLNSEVDLNTIDSLGNGAIHWAVTSGSIDVVKMLLESKMDCNIKNYEGKSAYQLAISNGNESIVKTMDSYKQ